MPARFHKQPEKKKAPVARGLVPDSMCLVPTKKAPVARGPGSVVSEASHPLPPAELALGAIGLPGVVVVGQLQVRLHQEADRTAPDQVGREVVQEDVDVELLQEHGLAALAVEFEVGAA